MLCGQLFFFKLWFDKQNSSLIWLYICFLNVFKNQSLGERCARPSSSVEAGAQSTCVNEVPEFEIKNLRKGLVGFYSSLPQPIKNEREMTPMFQLAWIVCCFIFEFAQVDIDSQSGHPEI